MADPKTESLTATLTASRARLSAHGHSIAAELNFGRRLRRSVARNRISWIAGAAVIGLLLAARRPGPRKVELRTKRKVDVKDAGKATLILAAGKLALDVLRPTLISWLGRRISPAPRP